jgi:hypothetical protein
VTAALATSSLASRASRRLPVALSLAIALGVPALAARALSGPFADALGDRVAFELANVLGPLSAVLTPPPMPDYVLTDTELASDAPASRVVSGPTKSTRSSKHGSRPAAPHAVRISAAQVLALAAHRAMPGANPVLASAGHPAGLQLRGVSALGLGLQDGDVLTEAAGQRASSVATVIGVVLAARARRSAEISGRFYRAGVPYSVTVEQPYPPGS